MVSNLELNSRNIEDYAFVLEAYENLMSVIENSQLTLNEDDHANIELAFKLAAFAHDPQKRKSGEPYITHPIEVAKICVQEIGLGPTAIISALLHDVVEDTDIGLEEIDKLFGSKISMIVDGLTKIDGTYKSNSPQAENFQKILSTLVKDVRVILIKMADRLHNLRTIGSVPRHKQLKIASETNFIYSPLAYRLGLYNIKTEFDDLCLKITNPDTYLEIFNKLEDTKEEREKFIAEFISPLKKAINSLGIKSRLYGRVKSISSIDHKIRTKHVPFEEVYDLFAIRVILDVPQEEEKTTCWRIYSLITDNYRPVTERLRDWISAPKSNGYESLHTTILGPNGKYVEVQIRSKRMEEIAEKGFAAHWKYKGLSSQPDIFDNWFDNIRDLIENQDNEDAVEFLDDFSANLFSKEVHVFTPKGDLRILPKKATALDFAFSIHTDIGYHCKSVKVNNKLEPLGYELKNGDQVSVTTDRNQKPREGWLKMAVTGKARSKIRSAMKEEKRREGMVGKEALERKLKSRKVNFEDSVDMLVKYYNQKSRVDLYYEISMDNINLKEINNFKVEGHKLIEPEKEQAPPPKESPSSIILKPQRASNSTKLTIEGESAAQYDYSLAKCCNPVQGDDVFGYISATSGLKIHRIDCPNATRLASRYGYRIMKAEWESTSTTDFIAELVITGIDDGPGVIERLTHNISFDQGLNIRSFSIDGDKGKFEGRIKLFVSNKDQLNVTIAALKKLSGVINVTRVK